VETREGKTIDISSSGLRFAAPGPLEQHRPEVLVQQPNMNYYSWNSAARKSNQYYANTEGKNAGPDAECRDGATSPNP
jgi:hypothetical protein